MTQQQLLILVDVEAASRKKEAAVEVRDTARLGCISREGAGDWLSALPSKTLGLHLRNTEFLTAAKYQLCLPVYRQEGQRPASTCKAVSNVFRDHVISCGYGGERIAKHNHMRDALHQAAAQAGLGPIREPDGLLPGSDDCPADLLLPFWHQGRDAAPS